MMPNPFSNATFETPLEIRRDIEAVRRDGARVEAILIRQYVVGFDWRGRQWRLYVPDGFEAAPSVPPSLHGVVPFWGGLFEASIVHDWCYWTRCFDDLSESGIGRLEADQLMVALLESAAVGEIATRNIYQAVRVFGGRAYLKNEFRPGSGPVAAAPG